MTDTKSARLFTRLSLPILFAILLCAVSARESRGQGFVSPLIGFNFGGDAGCPEIDDCEDKKINWGVSFGSLNNIVGFEAEFAYTDEFFGEVTNQDSSVLTLMGNFMLAPKIWAIQPYGVVGLGLIKTSVDLTLSGITNDDNNHFGWDVGGGVMVFFGEHVGVRGDIRYYHDFKELEVLGLPLPSEAKLDFGRAAAGVIFKF
jgi:opacity protein-like surface antigen